MPDGGDSALATWLDKLGSRMTRMEDRVEGLPSKADIALHERDLKDMDRRVDDLVKNMPTAADVAAQVRPYLREDVEAAWKLQRDQLPQIIRTVLNDWQREEREREAAILLKHGLELNEDGTAKPKVHPVKSFGAKNWVMILCTLAIVASFNFDWFIGLLRSGLGLIL